MRKAFGHSIVFVVMLLAPNILFSQTVGIKGRVRYGSEVLQAATVSIADKSVLTDKNGEFSFSITPGTCLIAITHAGYKKKEQTLTIDTSATIDLDFDMIPEGLLEEVIMLGSRSVVQRTNLSSPVPVDAFSSAQLTQTGQVSLTQMLSFVAPSFNASREVLNEPATLRGLDPDHVLILVNGIRYHNMVALFTGNLKGQLGRGSVGNDLNSIPFSSIEKIEILRDGAAAQYGSDAIAGVINIQLKKTTGNTSIKLHTGQFYKGDGGKFSLGINRGFAFLKRGVLNFSASYRYQEPTLRGGSYEDLVYKRYLPNATREDSIKIKAQDDSLVLARGFNRKTILDNAGNTKLTSAGLSVNGVYPLTMHSEVSWTILANSRVLNRSNAFIFPKDSTRLNFTLYPNGTQPRSWSNTVDLHIATGIKGVTESNWQWNISNSYGSNLLISRTKNSNNASQSYMGKDAPTNFYGGSSIYKLFTTGINFSKLFTFTDGIKNLNLSTGGEWRLENYQNKTGDSSSWYNYDPIRYPSVSVSGTSPENATNKSRSVWSSYLEIEPELSEKFLINAAMRYEYHSDFGGNIAGKLATRYKISNRLSIRASVSNGFRAPSLQQRYFSAVGINFITSGGTRVPVTRGIFSNNHPVTASFNIPPLTAEKSINSGVGFSAMIFKHISLAMDAYWIQIKNRIILSSPLDANTPGVKNILDNIPGYRISQVQFFANCIHTRTNGIDIVLNGNWNTGKGNLSACLAANFCSKHYAGEKISTNKLPPDPFDTLNTRGLFIIEEITKIEKGQPDSKISLSLQYKVGKTELLVRNTRFGKTSVAPIDRDPVTGVTRIWYEYFSSKILTDISLTYSLKPWMKITIGADNVFNIYPDRLKNYANTNHGSWIYSTEASPFGFNGGYYFLSLAFNK
jgi:iron complex outermembrane receptor protein